MGQIPTSKVNFTVMTLISYYDMVCKNHAIESLERIEDEGAWEALIHKKALEIMDTGDVSVRERVEIDNFGNILVVLNKPMVNQAVIAEAQWVFDSAEMSKEGVVEFGDSRTYTANEVTTHLDKYAGKLSFTDEPKIH